MVPSNGGSGRGGMRSCRKLSRGAINWKKRGEGKEFHLAVAIVYPLAISVAVAVMVALHPNAKGMPI